jgi:hypothetical protein
LAALDYVDNRAKQGLVEGSIAGYLRSVFESDSELGPSALKAKLKQEANAAAVQAKQIEVQQKAQRKAYDDAADRAKDRICALSPEALRAYAETFCQDESLLGWDDKKGKFRNTSENLLFKAWMLEKFRKLELGAS